MRISIILKRERQRYCYFSYYLFRSFDSKLIVKCDGSLTQRVYIGALFTSEITESRDPDSS